MAVCSSRVEPDFFPHPVRNYSGISRDGFRRFREPSANVNWGYDVNSLRLCANTDIARGCSGLTVPATVGIVDALLGNMVL